MTKTVLAKFGPITTMINRCGFAMTAYALIVGKQVTVIIWAWLVPA
ncbi:MAG: hypothetical protein H2056_07885 [Sphingopyxis sp.]|nr:hypothetical protein [Sphingopyxis sp.]